jgi:hypothetical protein
MIGDGGGSPLFRRVDAAVNPGGHAGIFGPTQRLRQLS